MNVGRVLKNKKVTGVLVIVVLLGILYATTLLLTQFRLATLRERITLQISKQQTLLVSVAETTARNGADKVTETIIKDCTSAERAEFDDLLSRLDKGLVSADLTKLERLFGRCGGFFAERKALMVMRLAREIEVYTDYIEQLDQVSDEKVFETYQLNTWRKLADEEKKQSELFSALVTQQDKIITTLLSGKRSDSEEIKAILQEARETQEMLIMTNRQAANTRAELIPL